MDEPPLSLEEAWRRELGRETVISQEPMLRRELDRVCRELRRLSKAHRRLWVANRGDAGRPQVVRELIRKSEEARTRSPATMVTWARLAAEVADALPGRASWLSLRADLQAEAWASLGNALRIKGNLRSAENAFAEAKTRLASGSGCRAPEAQLLHYLGALRRRQARHAEAVELISSAASTYDLAHDRNRAAIAWVSLAVARHEAGELQGAASAVASALQRADPGANPSVILAAANNLVFYLLQLGKVEDATDCFQAVKRCFAEYAAPTEALRLSWLEAKLAHATGQRVKAQALLDEVRRGFIELELPYDAALAGLELALRYAEAGRPADVERLATEMYPTFISSDLPAPAMATLMLFVKAVDAQAAHPAGIRELLSTLETQRYAEAD